MNVSGPIRKLIGDDATANALLAGRVFPSVLPQGQLAAGVCAVVSVVGVEPNDTKSGTSTEDSVTVQVSVFHADYDVAADTAEAVRGAIDGWRGDVTVGVFTYGIDGVRFRTGRDLYEADVEAHHIAWDYRVRYSRTGAAGVVGTVGLEYYESDAAALADGLETGAWYLLSANNIYGMKHGTPVKITES